MRRKAMKSSLRGGVVALAGACAASAVLASGLPDPLGTQAVRPVAAEASASSRGHVGADLAAVAQRRPQRLVEVIVQLEDGADPALTRAALVARRVRVGRRIPLINALAVTAPAADAARLAGVRGVRAVTLNAEVRPTGLFKGMRAAYTESIGAPALWNDERRSLTGRGVGVAIVDTGVAGNLPDFRVSRRNGLSRVRVSAVVNPHATDGSDGYGHGTHIAGLIAGNGANRPTDDPLRGGYIGVAPKARLVSIKASDDAGRTSVLDVIYGIQFAVDHKDAYNIRVLNLSLAATVAQSYTVDPLAAAAEAAWHSGIVVVAAAGNDGGDKASVSYAPGSAPHVLSVGAVDDKGTRDRSDDRRAGWSSRGLTADGHRKPEVLAPGAHMVSIVPRGSAFRAECPKCIRDEEYFKVGGTSMATAVASGAAALLLEAHPEWTPDQVKQALVSTARDVGDAGREIAVDAAVEARPSRSAQLYETHPMLGEGGGIDYTAASWRAASWRRLLADDPRAAPYSGRNWGCDCSLEGSGQVDPNAASWRAASWRTSFYK